MSPTPVSSTALPPSGRLVLVAAAALVDHENRVLIAERPPGRSMAGLWEFPGGKVETGETPERALVREYLCRNWEGELMPREGQRIKWVPAMRLADYPMPPADLPLLPFLRDLLG
jgi:8-oxo-dGTP diphosphatase